MPSRGVIHGLLAYGLWGLFPVYWKAIEAAPAHEILLHRMVWSLLFLVGILALRRDVAWLAPALRSRATLLRFLASASLLAVNWLTYIWAVNHGHIVESSLGYFINPLFSVLLGMVFLGERLRRGQAVAVGLAALAVGLLTVEKGVPPWIALVLAVTFGLYGLLRKTAPLGAFHGLTLETGILFLPALGALVVLQARGASHFATGHAALSLGLGLTGIVTAVPLLLFASAARQVSLTTLGFMQYVAPSLQFLVGVVVYHEALLAADLAAFVLIWAALALYSVEGLRFSRRRLRVPFGG